MWLKWQLRPIIFAVILMIGNLTGVPMRREDIENLLRAHNQGKAEDTMREEENDENKEPML